MSQVDDHLASAPFEGPEKLLEIWFAPSAADVPHIHSTEGKTGLRTVSRQVWEDMLDIVKCKVLSVIEGAEMDAYLLSESSLFVSPHRVILKTCGTTLNLLGLPRILEIAAHEANLNTVYRFFYSRKSFMFPERQHGPHRDWKQEVEYLDQIFKSGSAYTVGKVNGDHWLLYLTSPDSFTHGLDHNMSPHLDPPQDRHLDYTIEILMSDLSPKASQPFFFSDPPSEGVTPSSQAQELSEKLGITDIFPPSVTHLDAYAFQPCGYSSNAIIKWGHESLDYDSDSTSSSTGTTNSLNGSTTSVNCLNGHSANRVAQPGHFGEGYYTIHVTPEEGWSYASFECNIPLSTSKTSHEGKIPDLKSLVKRVVNIFEPGRITVTLFISSEDNDNGGDEEESAVEAAQRAFRAALTESPVPSLCSAKQNGHGNGLHRNYKRTDKINYEFGGYDLAFASFELR